MSIVDAGKTYTWKAETKLSTTIAINAYVQI